MASVTWAHDMAVVYDEVYGSGFEPAPLDPVVGLLTELAGCGAALEFAVGTGRVALPLSARGVPMQGIKLSPHMAERMRAKPGAEPFQSRLPR